MYFIALSGNENEVFWVGSKTANGFVIHSSNPNSYAQVDWILVR